MAELMGPKFCSGTSHDPRVGLCMIKFQKLASKKIRFSLNFEKPRKSFLHIEFKMLCNLTTIFTAKATISSIILSHYYIL